MPAWRAARTGPICWKECLESPLRATHRAFTVRLVSGSATRREEARTHDRLTLGMKSMRCYIVNATLTELRREAGKVLSAVLHRRQTVRLTQHGKPVAEILPWPQPLPPGEFARLWRARRPLGKETAEELAAALREMDAAG